jgi:hypothetical protein
MQGGQEEFVIAASDLVVDALARFGTVRFRAHGTSMAPAIRSGDVLEIERCRADELHVGDIVLVTSGERLLAHRLLRRADHDDGAVVVTRGDSHWRADAPAPLSAVLGRVTAIMRDGSSQVGPRYCSPIDRVRGLAQSQWQRLALALRNVVGGVVLSEPSSRH